MTISVEGQLLFADAADVAAMAALMRDVLARLVAAGMHYGEPADENLHQAPASADTRLADEGVMLEDGLSPYLLMVEPRRSPKERYHFVTVYSGSDIDADELATEWSRLCLRLGQLTAAVRPVAAIAWGRPAGSDPRPRLANLAAGKPPFDIGTWTYLSNDLLDENTARLLAELPGICRPTAAGTIITPMPLPGASIAQGVSRALAESARLRLFDPMAKQDRPRRR